ncbi:hypothetical protein [Vibrio sp.]
MVSEAGASVYSASELAAKEFQIWTFHCVALFLLLVVCRSSGRAGENRS